MKEITTKALLCGARTAELFLECPRLSAGRERDYY